MSTSPIPNSFLWRRLHSFAGIVFLLFLCEHLFTNSQATLFIGDDGKDFIRSVNFIHSIPGLTVLECAFIALPLIIHTWWGIIRMRTCRLNTEHGDMTAPCLNRYAKNQAFTWQRITAVLLIVAIGLHVYYMRFHRAPVERAGGYVVTVSQDAGLETLSKRLDVTLSGKGDGVEATSNTIGPAFLLVVRDTYKSYFMCVLYTLFVAIASFHGTNGLWTSAITWGVCLSEESQRRMRLASHVLMVLLVFLGLACIWGVYWINLRY